MNYRLLNGQVSTALLVLGGLVFLTGSSAIGRVDCTCKNIGGGFCIPDPSCYIAHDAGKAVEKAVRDIGKAIEKSAQDPGSTREKTIQDAGDAIAIGAKDAAQAADQAVKDNTINSVRILDTGYSQLAELGKEVPGYGLYSYAILASNSSQAAAFLAEIFKVIPPIDDAAAERGQLNIFYIPTKKERSLEFAKAVSALGNDHAKLGAQFSESFYDYRAARAILNHICNPPAERMRDLCQGDMRRGPYIFTYAKSASDLEPVPDPFLFVDLSDIDSRAFAEFVSAFRAQVKREDIADGARINSLRLRILPIALKAAEMIKPIRKAVGDIIRSPTDEKGK